MLNKLRRKLNLFKSVIKHNEFDINKFCLLLRHYITRDSNIYPIPSGLHRYSTYKTDKPQKGYICTKSQVKTLLPWHCINGNSRDSNMLLNTYL